MAATLVGLMLFVASCSGTTPGRPTAASSGANGATTSSAPSGSGLLPVTRPCSLLTHAELRQIGVSEPPVQDHVGTAPDCSLATPDDSIGVALRTDGGLSDLQSAGGTVHDTTIGAHQVKQEVDNTGSCLVAIGVTDSSRVDVTATGDGTTNPCPVAMNVAKLVEPKLP